MTLIEFCRRIEKMERTTEELARTKEEADAAYRKSVQFMVAEILRGGER